MNNESYFILSSSCRLVSGAKRNVIIDYDRNSLYFISRDYFDLITQMDRTRFEVVEEDIDSDSKVYFEEFMDFLITNEIGFLTTTPERYPRVSEEYFENGWAILMDVILEIDALYYKKNDFEKLCKDLKATNCKDVQIRFLSTLDMKLLREIVSLIHTTAANYIELHCTYTTDSDIYLLKEFIESEFLLSHIYVYGYPETKKIKIETKGSEHYATLLGTINFLDYPFNNGDCCGIINQKSFVFNDPSHHNWLKVRNGCLDKKLAIDRYGNIKNCPSLKHDFGNIRTSSILDIVQTRQFTSLGLINKDQISICKVCEFRYNCTDCRAFLQDPSDIYSKPLKCSYNPYTAVWEDIVT